MTVSAHRAELRVEDDALVRGAGNFMDDARLPGQTYAVFVRSPHASARIVAIDAAAARGARSVLAVLTAGDMADLKSTGRSPPIRGRGGKEVIQPFRPALAGERVRFVGEAVAIVVAESLSAAQDAAELVAVEYEEAPAVVDAQAALAAGAPQLHAEAPGNLAIDWPGVKENPDNEREIDAIIKGAPHVARLTLRNQRLAVASIEPRGATGVYDASADAYTLYCSSQSAGAVRNQTAPALGVANDKLRVLTGDIGGAFGMKSPVYPEYLALLVAAKKTGRPVHWMSTRAEAFMSDMAARDTYTDVELALDESGEFLALRMRHLCAIGAYVTPAGANINTANVARCLPCMYRIPKIDFGSRCVFTNTTPVGPYRGAGRPEANYVLDRAVEEAARITGLDSVRLRRKNLIPPSAMPYKTAIGTTYDSGDFPAVFAKALELADHKGFNRRRREAARRNRLRGIGVTCMLEHAGGLPMEGAILNFPGGDKLVLEINVQSTGQSHATVFGRLLADRLGIDRNTIEHRHGDSAFEIAGFASVASRSAMMAGHSIVVAIDAVLAKGKKVAAQLLEAAEADIQYRDGNFEVVGTDRCVSLFETARRAREMGESLDTKAQTETSPTFPNGVHVAEVEIDPDTGRVELAAYTAVDDCGNVLNSMVVEGQIQGGLANGFGQALLETIVYDAQGGQLLTGSFMDYAMPRAHDMPLEMREANVPVPTKTNPLGVKGTGEAGTTAAIAAVMNAIADAVPGGGAAHLDMPATPARVWDACRKGLAK